MQRTRSGGLRPPARAVELRRWALPMATLERMRNPAVLCSLPPTPPVLAANWFPHSLPCNASHHRPARVPTRAADTLCSSSVCSSRRSALKKRGCFGDTRVPALGQAPEVMAMLISVPSSVSAHTTYAVLSSAGAGPSAAPNHAFEGTACQRGCASLRPAVAPPQRNR
jgi:hypothetical protein